MEGRKLGMCFPSYGLLSALMVFGVLSKMRGRRLCNHVTVGLKNATNAVFDYSSFKRTIDCSREEEFRRLVPTNHGFFSTEVR